MKNRLTPEEFNELIIRIEACEGYDVGKRKDPAMGLSGNLTFAELEELGLRLILHAAYIRAGLIAEKAKREPAARPGRKRSRALSSSRAT